MSSPAASAEAPASVSVDPQDPLPESNWGWRRLFFFLALTALLAIKGWESTHNHFNWMTDALIVVVLVIYGIAPSAEQATKMFATVTAYKHGVTFQSRATATTAKSTVTSETSAGQAAPALSPQPPPAAAEPPLAPSEPERSPNPGDPEPAGDVEVRPRNVGAE